MGQRKGTQCGLHESGTMREFKDTVDNKTDCVNLLDIPTNNIDVPTIIQ